MHNYNEICQKQLLMWDGVRIYIVGGYVRDRLLQRECNDHDFVVVGATPQQMILCGFKKVGADFPVFLNENGDEFALARTERKTGSGYNGFETDYNPNVTLEEDLSRRDLTINSMAREVLGWNDEGHAKLSDIIFDPFNGQRDLANKYLRHTTDAFADDPLRVLRVARFAARYDFTVVGSTMTLMEKLVLGNEMEQLTKERIGQETKKAIMEEHNINYFRVLAHCGALSRLFPDMSLSILQPLLKTTHRNENLMMRMVSLSLNITADDLVGYFAGMNIPSNIIDIMLFVRRYLDNDMEAYDYILSLNEINAYQDDTQLFNLVQFADIVGDQYPLLKRRTDNMLQAYQLSKHISFAELTANQQSTLRGNEISNAINNKRRFVFETNKR